MPSQDDAFNYVQSSTRMPVECLFGMLVRCYGVLWRPLQVAFRRRAPLISALLRLHNFRIEQNDPSLVEYPRKIRRVKIGDNIIQKEMWEVLPGQWEYPPPLDDDGNPIHLLSRRVDQPESEVEHAINVEEEGRTSTFERLRTAVSNAGITRPLGNRVKHTGWNYN